MKFDGIIAICGPKCTECEAYNATRSGRAELEWVAAKWTEGLGRPFAAEDILCDGCRVEGGRLSAYCSTCGIRTCALSRNFETCAECPECPCEKIVAPQAIEALAGLKRLLS